jgi:hypothetical protein
MEEDTEPEAATEGGKRKAPAKKSQTKKTKLSDGTAATSNGQEAQGNSFESIFEPELLEQPKLLTVEEMEKALVERQKKMLLEEYGA